MTKHQILKNILPFYDTFKGYAETYNIEVADRESSSDSLFLAKSSIVDLFRDLLQEKRGFKYVLSATATLKRWNNAINRYDIESVNQSILILKQ